MQKPEKFRQKALVIAKITVAALLIYWLSATGKLDLRGISVYWQDGGRLAWAALGLWLFGAVVSGSLRWHALIKGLGGRLSRLQAVRLNLIGLFFNTIMPGVVGGDLIKALYLSKHEPHLSKTAVLFSAFLDRAIGLGALFIISLGGLVLNWPAVAAHPVLEPLVYMVLVICCLGGVAATFLIFPWRPIAQHRYYRSLREKILQWPVVGALLQALLAYRKNPRAIAIALGLSLFYQGFFVWLFLEVTAKVVGPDLPIGLLLTILPLAMVSTAIPLAPGGLGVGHVAFEKLFHMVGLSDGANVFNIIALGQLVLNLLGVIPYIFYKAEVEDVLKRSDLAAPPPLPAGSSRS